MNIIPNIVKRSLLENMIEESDFSKEDVKLYLDGLDYFRNQMDYASFIVETLLLIKKIYIKDYHETATGDNRYDIYHTCLEEITETSYVKYKNKYLFDNYKKDGLSIERFIDAIITWLFYCDLQQEFYIGQKNLLKFSY